MKSPKEIKKKLMEEFENEFGVAYKMSKEGTELVTQVDYISMDRILRFLSSAFDELERDIVIIIFEQLGKYIKYNPITENYEIDNQVYSAFREECLESIKKQ